MKKLIVVLGIMVVSLVLTPLAWAGAPTGDASAAAKRLVVFELFSTG